jgi:hypothetical protein
VSYRRTRWQHLRDRLGANRDCNAIDNLLVHEWRNALGSDLHQRRHHVIGHTNYHVLVLQRHTFRSVVRHRWNHVIGHTNYHVLVQQWRLSQRLYLHPHDDIVIRGIDEHHVLVQQWRLSQRLYLHPHDDIVVVLRRHRFDFNHLFV